MHRLPRASLCFALPAASLLLCLGGCSASPTNANGLAPANSASSNDDAGGNSEPSGGATPSGSNGSPGTGDDDAQAPSVPAQDAGGATALEGGAVSGGDADTPSDASSGGDGQTDASTDAATDAGALVNGCTEADYVLHDESGANGVRTIAFAKAAPATQYVPNCMRIAKGQSVTWGGDLKLFPLDPLGGTTPTPIKATKKGTTVTFAFDTAGTYGFDSSAQPKVMFGAIDVLP